jgi:hypothetical protein
MDVTENGSMRSLDRSGLNGSSDVRPPSQPRVEGQVLLESE